MMYNCSLNGGGLVLSFQKSFPKMPFSFLNFSFILTLTTITLAELSNGFSLDLIHPLSPESPFSNHNITYSDMLNMFDDAQVQSHSHIQPMSFHDNTNSIRPKLESAMEGYLIKVNLGNFSHEQPPYKTYYLLFDISSDIIWLQCEDCTKPEGHCFEQVGQPYPNHMSKSYVPLLCGNHRLCFRHQCLGQYCSYSKQYVDGSASFGVLAYETFELGTYDRGRRHQYAKIVIGCGTDNKLLNVDKRLNEVGVLGMGWNSHSFVNQLTSRSHGRFSYCLPPLINNNPKGESSHDRPSTVLRFGSDTPTVHHLSKLRIYQYWAHDFYYVDLEGISINNMRLDITPSYFANTGPRNGGCILDTGTAYSSLPRQAFIILKDEMMKYLGRTDSSLKIREKTRDNSLCYWRDRPFKGYKDLPTITFHFKDGVDLVQQSDVAFIVWEKTDKEYVCMSIVQTSDKENNMAVIGTQSQANHVFVYDLPSKMLYFGPQDCTQNP